MVVIEHSARRFGLEGSSVASSVRFWPIADAWPNDPAQAILMSGFDPKRTFRD